MSNRLSDLRLALRNLWRRPGFSLAVIGILAVGLGASTTVFSLFHDVLLQPLPYPEAGELVYVGWQEGEEDAVTGTSPPDFLDLQAASESFESLAALAGESFAVAGEEGAERLSAAFVTPGFFRVFGIPLVAGRTPTAEEERLLVISEDLAERRFGGARAALGRKLDLDGEPWTVAGVAPGGLDVPEGAQLWLPGPLPPVQRGARFLQVVGRLAEGVSLEQARSEVAAISEGLAREYPDTNRDTGAFVVGLHQNLTREVRPALVALLVAVGCVLLLVTANAAALLLARAVSRSRELGVRAALGASRLRLVRQIVVESLLLSLLGALGGLLLAVWGGRGLVSLFPLDLPLVEDFGLSPASLWVHFGLAVVVGVLCGLVPGLHAVRRGTMGTVSLGAGRRVGGRSTARLQGLILVPQIAATLVLLIGAGLMLTSLVKLLRVDPGFETADRLVARVILPQNAYPERGQQAAFFRELLRELESRPGIVSVAGVTNLPLSGTNMLFPIEPVDGVQVDGEPTMANYRAATPGYFRILGTEVRGREIEDRDVSDATPVAVVNETLAKQLFPGLDPIGRSLVIGYGDRSERRVVGVVGNLRHFGLAEDPKPEVYVPFAQHPWPFLNLVLEARGDVAMLAPSVRGTVASLDRRLPVEQLRPMSELVGTQTARPRFYTVLLGAFGIVALFVAAVGIYGLTAYGVRLRRAEIGVRMALGATRREIFTHFLRRPLRLALIGTAVGVGAAMLLARGLASLLYDLSPLDPWFYLGAAAVLMATTVLAGGLPARQAAHVDPVRSLQAD